MRAGTPSRTGGRPCSPTTRLDTLSVGTKTVVVSARDRAGHPFGPVTLTYQVLGYTFVGFLPPIENPPMVNVVTAGNSVPIKFSLSGYRGLGIFAPNSPFSQQVPCPPGPQDPGDETVPPGSSTLSFNPLMNQYRYVWKTQKTWQGTCRLLTVRLKDGVDRTANFRFK
jgi:hypothetical protein